MPHSNELLERIKSLLEVDYPLDRYNYSFEKAIKGTRMHPDILVCDEDGRMLCAVEIGYTRPEKLTAYRSELSIPDVRWYDKTGKLHGDVEERSVLVRIEAVPQGKFVVYHFTELVECPSKECQQMAEEEFDVDFDPESEISSEESDRWSEVIEYLVSDTSTYLVTDYVRVWVGCFCDKCGEIWPAQSEDEDISLWNVIEDLRTWTPQQFGMAWGRRLFEGSWNETRSYIEQWFQGFELEFQNGIFLYPSEREEAGRAIRAIRQESQFY
jgi:hypothetical protein